MTRARMLAVAAVLSSVLLAGAVRAADCQVANVTAINFGAYEVDAMAPLDSTGELAVECNAVMPVKISLGRGASGHQSPRELKFRSNVLAYNLYLDAAHTLVWGDGTDATQVFSGLAPAQAPLMLPIFARLFPRQIVPPGTYTDRVVVVVVF
jgi:spore coat protein U domain-containing protein, fimbrial subunit CupE1/2/3/6